MTATTTVRHGLIGAARQKVSGSGSCRPPNILLMIGRGKHRSGFARQTTRIAAIGDDEYMARRNGPNLRRNVVRRDPIDGDRFLRIPWKPVRLVGGFVVVPMPSVIDEHAR